MSDTIRECDVCAEDRDALTICEECEAGNEARIRADERERCAQVAEQWRTQDGEGSRFCPPEVAAAIRARGGGK